MQSKAFLVFFIMLNAVATLGSGGHKRNSGDDRCSTSNSDQRHESGEETTFVEQCGLACEAAKA